MHTIPHRDMERTVDVFDAKTREIPRPTPPEPGPIPSVWHANGVHYTHTATSPTGSYNDVIVAKAVGCIEVQSEDSRQSIQALVDLFSWFARGGQ